MVLCYLHLNQIKLINQKFGDGFYQYVQSYKYYNNSLPDGIYAFNFGIYPEEIQPSGIVNLSLIKGKTSSISMNSNFL